MTGTRWARKNLQVLVSACVSLATISLSAKEPEFSRNRDLPPLTLKAADLDTILQKAHSFIAAANGSSGEQDSVRESVTLGVGGKEIEIPHFSLASSVAFPKEVFRFSYTYYRPDKPISSVTIDLGDYLRRVSVSGKAADQVEAISNLLEKDLLGHSTAIGGAMFRRVAGVCLSLTLLASLIVSSAYCWKTGRHPALGMPICSALGLMLLFRLPWDRYLPGFALYQSYSPFFLIRYAPQIALLSLLAALAGIPLSYFLARRER
jgi:hypothetical protein